MAFPCRLFAAQPIPLLIGHCAILSRSYMRHFVSQPGKRKNMPGIAKSTQSRRTFCGSVAHFTSALAFLPLADLFASCDTPPKKQILRPSVQINTTSFITNTRYIGDAFVFTEQM